MNAIQKALSDLTFKIPKTVLEIAFKEDYPIINQVISLDERILSQVIRKRVLIDCDLVGGINLNIKLSDCNVRWLGNVDYIIEVPKSATNNKLIITPLNLLSMLTYNARTPDNNTSSMLSVANNMYNNLANDATIQTSRLELIGDNTILVQEPSIGLIDATLACVVQNSSNLENINPRSYLGFSQLVTLAVKSYIYNTLRIRLDQGYIYNGHELGVINDIISEYADAETMYIEYLTTTWRKVAFMNNSKSMDNFIMGMIGNTI